MMEERESWWCVAEGDDSLPGKEKRAFGLAVHGGGSRRKDVWLMIAPGFFCSRPDLT